MTVQFHCRYEDKGSVRPIIHRASLVEMVSLPVHALSTGLLCCNMAFADLSWAAKLGYGQLEL